ncbi:PAAR-like protein [Leptotrichia buccalis]|jgi:hypothetical protein|uniref:Uncharacterized protein n=1 Tax=Leptotrichia buccalis (strain ATCC 14201 / DSM 1135 / JCM 12969 / NCTC 10249 / C-1013-b) TaxID=523794 RepID=C7N9G6_LEPBD|nr:PAAR-like protein [Leptotrichia buccalis]ACV38797.1 hypothetical protein Lebu_0894 [Leptotrichia buccalis C-1013-b]
MAREKYQGMYDSSMSGLERSRRQTAEAIKEAEARKKEEAEKDKINRDAVNNQIAELGRVPVAKGDESTIICDGATMKCSMGIFGSMVQDISSKIVLMKPDFSATNEDEVNDMITFKVPKAKVYLMGIDAAGTTVDLKPENFEIKPGLNCAANCGKPCELKNHILGWVNFSDDVIIDGANVLIKGSRLVCGIFPDAKITFTDNGQDPEIEEAKWDKIFSPFGWNPAGKKVVKSIYPTFSIGSGIIEIIDGNVVAGGYSVFSGGRDLVNIWTGEDILLNMGKGTISLGSKVLGKNVSKENLNYWSNVVVGTNDFLIAPVMNYKDSVKFNYSNLEEDIKLINENSKIHIKLKNNNIKNPKLPDYTIEINADVKKEIVGFNLEPKKTSKTLVNSQIEKKIGKINSEDYNFMVNIEYAKNPFLTRVKNPNYKREEKK